MDANVRYLVINERGFPSFTNKTDEPISFRNYKQAEKHAKKLAEDEPGKSFFIFEHVTEVKVPGGEAECYRRYPMEHYKEPRRSI